MQLYIYLMFYLTFLNHSFGWSNIYIYFLTNFNNNILLVISLWCIIYFYNKNFNTWIFGVFIILLYTIKLKDVIALHNILFIYHPYILYFTVICLMVINCNQIFVKTMLLVLCWVSFSLGGVWAMQEFNWGGWWNWDSLELGILFLLLHITYFMHINFNFYIKKYYQYGILSYLLITWLSNKLGLTISIHSFIQNNAFLKYNNCTIVLGLCFLKFTNILICISIHMWLLFNNNGFIYVYKLIMLIIIIITTIKIFKKINLYKFHQIWLYVSGINILINYNNIIFYKNSIIVKYVNMVSLTPKNIIFSYNSHLTILKKNFFFFKFKLINWLGIIWDYQLTNLHSNQLWFLIF